MGNQLLPYVISAIDTFRQGASAIMALAQANPKLTSGLVEGVGAFVAIASVITIASYALLAFIYPFTQLRSMMLAFNVATKLAAAGQWALNIAMSANPIGLVIAGIAALIGIGYLLYKNWDMIKIAGSQLWSTISSKFSGGVDYVKTFIINSFNTITGFILSIPNVIAYGIGYIIGFIMQLPTAIPIMASIFMANTISWLSNVYAISISWINNTVISVYQILMNLPSYCMQAGMQFVANVESWASSAYNAVASWINQIPNLVATALANAASSASSWWEGVKASFTIGMEEGSAKPQMALASGGIFRKGAFITSFAEDSPEAAIPIDGSNRAIALWQKTGELLGINNLKNNDTKGKYNKPIVQSVSKTDKTIMMQENEDEISGIKNYMLSGLQKIASLSNVTQVNNTKKRDNLLVDNKPNNILITSNLFKTDGSEKDEDETSGIKSYMLSGLQKMASLANVVQLNNTIDKNKVTPKFMPVAKYNENTNSIMPNPFDIIGRFLNEQSASNVTNNSNIGDNRINITYSPNISIKSDGKNENLVNNVKQALTTDKENLIQLIQKVLKDMDNDKNRLAFN